MAKWFLILYKFASGDKSNRSVRVVGVWGEGWCGYFSLMTWIIFTRLTIFAGILDWVRGEVGDVEPSLTGQVLLQKLGKSANCGTGDRKYPRLV